ncbi:hypothetical protein GLYMA_15G006200v4 [Glycine max]|uniref:uncharacterized protein isoform X3 n=1 Tax=Glycine max TaxID=3847 RepID=UPI00023D2D05|nr:uncharacterized protein LOC102660607 isoform X3 [Glycine max]KAG4380732.1 hypothetical protein GLYMA_15G006200v4 [Glycine max]KAH1144848.1 hypothetical protein GYH30_040936 [Glycine max]|eukprot:XP_014623526.1 uncharacterized protein LOC102660607 isoform X3 [Glycine max]
MVAAACESETESGGTCCRCVTCKHHSTHFLLSQCPSLLNLITHALDSYLGEYANAYGGGGAAAAIVVDAWMDVISSQGSSLLKLLLQ